MEYKLVPPGLYTGTQHWSVSYLIKVAVRIALYLPPVVVAGWGLLILLEPLVLAYQQNPANLAAGAAFLVGAAVLGKVIRWLVRNTLFPL